MTGEDLARPRNVRDQYEHWTRRIEAAATHCGAEVGGYRRERREVVEPGLFEVQHERKPGRRRLVMGVTTLNRLPYIRRFVETFNATRSPEYEWVLVVGDDGSTDGTLDYLRALELPDLTVVVVANKKRSVAGQTNTIFMVAARLSFDFGFKCDDDIYFTESGWDEAYLRDAELSGFDHLVLHDTAWKPAEHDRTRDGLVSAVPARSAMGCMWTFTPRLLERIGVFDEHNFRLRGHAHLDFTLRACRAGFNESDGLWDSAAGTSKVAMWPRDGYVQTIDWKGAETRAVLTPEERARRDELISREERIRVPLEGAVVPGPGSVVWATGPLASFEMDGLLGLRRPAPLDRLGDRCQVLNLGHDLHKWATVVERFASVGVSVRRFAASNGNAPELANAWGSYASRGLELPLERQIGRRLIASPGAWGYLATMVDLLGQATEERLERVVVFDDDVLVHHDFGPLLESALDELPADWEIVYLGCTQKDRSAVEVLSEHIYRPRGPVNGSFAVALRASVFKELLDEMSVFTAPYDSGALSTVAHRHAGTTYVIRPNLVVADVSTSDLRLERDPEDFARKAGWQLADYDARIAPRPGRALDPATMVSVLAPIGRVSQRSVDVLRAVLDQSYGAMEVLVQVSEEHLDVDDIRKATGDDPRVRVLVTEVTLAQHEAWNLLLESVRGGFVMPLHTMRRLDRGAVAWLVDRLRTEPNAYAVYGATGRDTDVAGATLLRAEVFQVCGHFLAPGRSGIGEIVARFEIAQRRTKGRASSMLRSDGDVPGLLYDPEHRELHELVRRGTRPTYLRGSLPARYCVLETR